MHEREVKPIWTSATFLVYAGGLTVLLGGLAALAYLSAQFPGKGQETAWALLILVILYLIAHALRIRDRPIAAGVFAFTSVIAWGALVIIALEWWGLNVNAPLSRWSWPRTLAILLILAAAWDDRRRFRFPFIASISALFGWLLVLDLLPAGGNKTAVWALIVGLAYLLAGSIRDEPSAFWLHLVGGALIGGAFLFWAHTSDGDFAVVSIVALLFVGVAYATRRSSWAVFGTIGFFVATTHYIVGSPTALAQGAFGLGATQSCTATGSGPAVCTSLGPASGISPWSPALAFGLLGFWLVLLGLLGRRRQRASVEPAHA